MEELPLMVKEIYKASSTVELEMNLAKTKTMTNQEDGAPTIIDDA